MAPKLNRKTNPRHSQAKSSRVVRGHQRKPRPPEKILQSRRSRLYQQLDKGFHQNALKTCDQLLRQLDSEDTTLIDTKAKLLTVLEDYQETLDYLSRQTYESPGLKLLEAYCLYKLGQFEKASETLRDPAIALQEDIQRAKIALESQILFKLGQYTEAKSRLEELVVDSEPNHPEYLDINANLSACQARISFIEKYIPSQINLVDLDRLESAPITSSFFQSHPHFPTSSRPRLSKPTKRSRTLKSDKPLDPSRPPPDPDRWLPRREKEAAKPSKRGAAAHLKAKQKLATQGSVSAAPIPSADVSSHKTTKQAQRKKKNKK